MEEQIAFDRTDLEGILTVLSHCYNLSLSRDVGDAARVASDVTPSTLTSVIAQCQQLIAEGLGDVEVPDQSTS